MTISPGLYEQIVTAGLQKELAALPPELQDRRPFHFPKDTFFPAKYRKAPEKRSWKFLLPLASRHPKSGR